MSQHRRRARPFAGATATLERPASLADRIGPPPAERRSRRATRSAVPRVRLRPAMSAARRWQFRVLVLAWVGVTFFFWQWWLSPSHIGEPLLFVAVSVSFLYIATVLPSFYLFYVGQMRLPVAPAIDAPGAAAVGSVAVITLTVPGSESLEIVKRQLLCMAAITRDHDSWILVDKEHSPEIEFLAEAAGVRYFCRHDVPRWGEAQVRAWNGAVPPFQTKTKAGNVNAWLDAHGAQYSHFTQLDIDHLPTPGYLDEVLPYFADPAVAWVQAPSVYGNHENWTARGSTEQEVVLQGPLQMGFFGFSQTPMIIGSHCTYDRAAIDGIGGFATTRAEDHLDTVLLAAQQRRGVFVPKVIATGDGPETFETYLAQQFAWAYSMIQVLFRYTPRLVRNYSPRQALQFLFVQTWYLLWSLAMLALFVAPSVALMLDAPISHVRVAHFYLHSIPLGAMSALAWVWSRTWFQPAGAGLTWRGIVLHIARWVVVVSALVQVILRVQKPYMITVKGLTADGRRPYRFRTLAPYVMLGAGALGACWFYLAVHHRSSNQGYLFFALAGAAVFGILVSVVTFQEVKERRRRSVPTARALLACATPIAASVLLLAGVAVTAAVSGGRIVEAFTA